MHLLQYCLKVLAKLPRISYKLWHTLLLNAFISVCNLCRLSRFFDLPYWEDLKINQLFGPMHIKNVVTTMWDHLMGVRDTLEIHVELQCCEKMCSAWPVSARVGK
jgi:hypothetical protein